ncbi:MAG: homoserine O-succinyltransferase [Chitinophagaceae bacterium]|nr:homoserine O-succinyltransferase [Chitinophagaceae bacterium]MBP7108769.1 homoserine O-succinyltransferase [Chitinophagaceae bacterium]MBP7314627.1 homoserine O-succinyltransferase [Chitinophagaceae bacterium]
MSWMEKRSVKVAILDLYDGYENQGMRCIRTLLKEWAETNDLDVQSTEFNVRQKDELPDTSYDVYISSGGPGDPLKSRFEDWDIAWIRWLDNIVRWNKNPNTTEKKHVFFICHSFQLACRYFNAGIVCKRKSNSFGVFPMHMLEAGKDEPVLNGLKDPFYAVDSRDFQVIQPNHQLLNEMGASILCIEKSRPHVPYERAVMGIRFNEYMIGTQFHPEADATGMSVHLQTEEKRQSVIENHGEEKLNNMLEHLSDPDKILWTYSHIIPNFLNQSIEQLQEVMA